MTCFRHFRSPATYLLPLVSFRPPLHHPCFPVPHRNLVYLVTPTSTPRRAFYRPLFYSKNLALATTVVPIEWGRLLSHLQGRRLHLFYLILTSELKLDHLAATSNAHSPPVIANTPCPPLLPHRSHGAEQLLCGRSTISLYSFVLPTRLTRYDFRLPSARSCQIVAVLCLRTKKKTAKTYKNGGG